MKRMILLTVIIAALFVLLMPMGTVAASKHLYDPDELLSFDEGARLEAKLQEASASSGIKHYVYVRHRESSDIEVSESELFRALSINGQDDAIILAIDCYAEVNYYELFTYGEGYRLLDDSDCDSILDDDVVYSSIKSDRLYDGAARFALVSTQEVISGRRSSRTMGIVMPIIIGLLSGAIAVLCVVISYKRKLKSPSYPLNKYASLDLQHSSDNYLTATVTRTRIQTSSGGRSGGGGSRGRR